MGHLSTGIVAVDDLDATVALAESLGGEHVKTNVLPNGVEWRVMRDPDDNQFCIYVE